IRIDGWMSRSKAREAIGNKQATADAAWDCLTINISSASEKVRQWVRARRPEDRDDVQAKAALAWARELDPADPSDYQSNLGRVARGEVVKNRNAGLLA